MTMIYKCDKIIVSIYGGAILNDKKTTGTN
jgi:hypothetical protein